MPRRKVTALDGRKWTLGRRWLARSGDERLEWPVVGYFNSRRKLDELAGRLSLGGKLERAAGDGR